jgi:hypothetical protein
LELVERGEAKVALLMLRAQMLRTRFVISWYLRCLLAVSWWFSSVCCCPLKEMHDWLQWGSNVNIMYAQIICYPNNVFMHIKTKKYFLILHATL